MLCSLLPDERLHKGFEGTGPGQCGGAAERPQVSLSPRGSESFRFLVDLDVVLTGIEELEHQAQPLAYFNTFILSNNMLRLVPFLSAPFYRWKILRFREVKDLITSSYMALRSWLDSPVKAASQVSLPPSPLAPIPGCP